MLRAARFAGSLGFSIEEKTWDAICEKSSCISRAAPARLFDETLKLFLLGSARDVFPVIDKCGLFSTMFPLFNQWLFANRDRAAFLHSILARIDQMIEEDSQVSPHLLLAAIFGPCLEDQALVRHRNGMPRLQAIDASCAVFLEDTCRTVRIPAKTGNLIRNILTFQHSLHKVPPRRPESLASRSEFNDALSYLQIISDLRNTGNPSILWWNNFLASRTLETIDSNKPDDMPKKKRRKRRRNRKTPE
jgi:poly(A) polymerase